MVSILVERGHIITAGRVSQLTRQSQEWSSTMDSMQQSRTQERLESQQIIAAKVTNYGEGLLMSCTSVGGTIN